MTLRTLFSAGIFLGSFLLFQLQLLTGKLLLPGFGGDPLVWNSCILFFQAVLLAGYIYAHGVTSLCAKYQRLLHVVLLLCSFPLLLGFFPAGWKPADGHISPLEIMQLLGSAIGLPYLLLSASAPLLQSWHVQRFPGISPWPLYAISNGASLLALVSYPLLVEPLLTLPAQSLAWKCGFGFYIFLCGCCAFAVRTERDDVACQITDDSPGIFAAVPTPTRNLLLWFLLSACGSAMLLVVTNDLSTSIAPVPLIWMMPLAVYLLTFIACFARTRSYSRVVWGIVLVFSVSCLFAFRILAIPVMPVWQILLNLLMLAGTCMFLHGELVSLRPDRRRLTVFYLSITAGGALGSAFLTLAAPVLFSRVLGLPVVLAVSCAALILSFIRPVGRKTSSGEMLL